MNKPPPDAVEKLRKAYQRSLEERSRNRSDCPEPEAILSLVEGEGGESLRLETLDHVMQCGACHQEFELLRSLREARGHSSSRLRPWMAIAASVVLMVGVGYGAWQGMDGGEPVYRGGESEVTLIRPAAGEVVSGDQQFLWASEPDAFQYIFEIVDSQGGPLLTRTTADTTLSLTSQELSHLQGSVRWWVRARLRDGTEAASDARPLNLPPG